MANDRSRPFSLSRLSFIAICIFAVSSLLALSALVGVQKSSQEAVASWRQFADQGSVEQRALRAFVTQAGVAGLVDDYHRLAVTGDEALVPMVYGRGGAALGALATYPLDGATKDEIAAKAALQALLRAYMLRVSTITAMHQAHQPVGSILAASEIDGREGAVALTTLAAATAHSMMSGDTLTDSKALILLDIRRQLGLEGLVQNANRFLDGSDAVALEQVRKDISSAEAAVQRYGRHNMSANEAVALKAFAAEIARIEPQISKSKAAGVRIFDTHALQARLLNLEKFAYAEAVVAQNNLQTTLGKVSKRAGSLIALVGVGSIVLIGGSVWLFAFRIGRRLKAITGAMRDLANGKLDAEIPAVGDRDEIGEMSRALLVFRDGLRANATLTTELAESSRLASLGAMVAGMAHELNTPLGNALAVSSTLEEQCKTLRKDLGSERILRSVLDRHAAGLEDAAALIQRNLVRAAEQIGSFKQVAVDQTSGQRREFHLDDVLSSVIQSMHPTFKRTPFVLEFVEASGAVMDSYPGALSQVVTNLIENGLKHGLSGRLSGRVLVSARCLGPQATEITVSDDGTGIPDEVRPSIFTAFFTTKAGKGGSGLGLHIVKSIVCGPLGGEISVLSDPGQGARFVLTLPNKAPIEGASDPATERTYYAAAQHAA